MRMIEFYRNLFLFVFQELARNMHGDSSQCVDIPANYVNINHMLECENHHSFESDAIPKEPQLTERTQCIVEILHVVSPIRFEVRIHKYYEDSEGWRNWNSAEQFDKFSKDLQEFHTKIFNPVENISNVDKNTLFVYRKGEIFSRCMILDIK